MLELILSLIVFILVFTLLMPHSSFERIESAMGGLLKRKRIVVDFKQKDSVIQNRIYGILIKIARILYNLLPNALKTLNSENINKKIIYAGLEQKIEKEEIIGLKYLLALISAGYVFFLFIASGERFLLLLCILTGFIGYIIPTDYLKSKAKKRMEDIFRNIPPTFTTMAILLDSGLNLQQAVEESAKISDNELTREIEKAMQEAKMGISFQSSLERVMDRCNIEELGRFISFIIQGLERGSIGMSRIVRQMADESWDRRKKKAQEHAQKVSMKLFLLLMAFVFPAFIIFLMGPLAFSVIKVLGGSM